jgi:hypothetical protein
MAIYYCDLVNGSDSNNGTSWAQAKLTLAAAAGLGGAGDTVRCAKTTDKVSIGSATWTQGPIPGTKSISSSTNASPIQITTSTSHGYSTGDVIQISGHTTNTNANGNWIITVNGTTTFTLNGSTGNGVGGASGTAQNINAKTVKLASALTTTINNTETAWTSANSYTAGVNTNSKQGVNSAQITAPASPTNAKAAYFTLPATLNLSSYDSITFWAYANTGAIANGAWTIRLCSDTTGDVTVDTFSITPIGTTANWVAFTLTRNGGGSLGASIASIAIYGTTSVVANSVVLLDNISAASSTGLNLKSIISPVSSNTDIFDNYPIQSIDGTLVLIDNGFNNGGTIGRGYYSTNGGSGSLTTYIRIPVSPASMSTVLTGNIFFNPIPINVNNNPMIIEGGYNTGTTTIDGLSVVNLNIGTGLTPRNFYTISGFGMVRGSIGFQMQNAIPGVNAYNIFSTGCSNNGFQFVQGISTQTASGPNNINNICANNVGNIGINANLLPTYLTSCVSKNNYGNGTATIGSGFALNVAGTILSCDGSNNYSSGFYFSSGGQCKLYNCTAKYNGNFSSNTGSGVDSAGGAGDVWFYSLTTVGNNSSVFNTQTGASNFYFTNTTYSEANFSSNSYNFIMGYIYQYNNNAANNIVIGTNGAVITNDASTTHGTASFSWKINLTAVARESNNPVNLPIAQVYCTANVSMTISAWVKKDSTSALVNKLIVPGYQIAGVTSDQVATGTSTTAWEQLSVTFTPTASGVVTVYAQAYLTGATTNVNAWVSDLTLPAGVNTSNMAYTISGLPWVQNNAPGVSYAAVGL